MVCGDEVADLAKTQHTDLLSRCWVRLDCNNGFKGWCTTLDPSPFVVVSALPWFCAVKNVKIVFPT